MTTVQEHAALILESLRDKDLLARARKAAEETSPEDLVVYDETALAELRRR